MKHVFVLHTHIAQISQYLSIKNVIDTLNNIIFPHLYVFIFIFIGLEEMGIPMPLPGEFFAFLAGYRIEQGDASFIVVFFLILVSTIIGSSILYSVIYWKGLPVIEKYGKYFFMKEKRIQEVHGWFLKHGFDAIILGRWVFGIRILANIFGGLFRYPYKKFISAVSVATVVWTLFYLSLGIILGKYYLGIINFLNQFNGILVEGIYLAILPLITFLFIKYIAGKYKD